MAATPSRHQRSPRLPRKMRGSLPLSLLGILAAACGGRQSPPALATGFAPAEIAVETPVEGEETPLAIKVLVADEVAAAVPHWRDELAEDLDLANQLLVPAIGARFEIKASTALPNSPPDQPPTADPVAATDVHLTIAYLPALATPTDDLHSYAAPVIAARKVRLHRLDSAAERAVLESALASAPAADRPMLIDARLRHKRALILIHALGHALGALDTEERGAVMRPQYDRSQKGVAKVNRTAMRELLPAFAALGDDVRLRRTVLNYLETTAWPGWIVETRHHLLDDLRARVTIDLATAVAPPSSPEIQSQLGEIDAAARRGDANTAKEKTDALIAMYPADARLRLLGCRLGLAAEGMSSAWATGHCDKFEALAPGDPSALLELAAVMVRDGEIDGAASTLAEATTRADNLGDGAAAAFATIARAYQALGLVSLAEQTAARSDGPTNQSIAAWAGPLRARYGLPANAEKFAISPLREGSYVAGVRAILDLVYAEKFADAELALAAELKRFPNAPGLLAARCDLQLRRKQEANAKRSCDLALKYGPNTSWALYLRAILSLKEKRDKAAITALDRAITLDPELRQAWRALAKALARKKDVAALDALRARYQALFGAPLPE